MLKADARLDIMLFERVRDGDSDGDDDDEEWEGGSLDPSSLLNVVGALAKLTGGLPIDPASGAVLIVRSRAKSRESRARLATSQLAHHRSYSGSRLLTLNSRLFPCLPKKSNPAPSSITTIART